MYTRICYGKRDMLYNYSEFVCDTVDDIENLPTTRKKGIDKATCSVGSKVLVIETKETYILNNSDVWVLYNGNIGNDDTSVEYASIDETKTYLGI